MKERSNHTKLAFNGQLFYIIYYFTWKDSPSSSGSLCPKRWLNDSEMVAQFTMKDLEDAEKQLNVKVQSGDIVLVRTGFYRRRQEQGPIDPSKDGTPGPDPSILQFLSSTKTLITSGTVI